MNIQDNYSFESSTKPLNYDYDLYKPLSPKLNQNDYVRYRTLQTENSNDEVNIMKSKLEEKKIKLKEMQVKIDSLIEENSSLKNKLSELEKKFIEDLSNENRQTQRERDLIEIIKKIEEEVSNYHKILNFRRPNLTKN